LPFWHILAAVGVFSSFFVEAFVSLKFGVIADNVGDNVGDCAGMAADLFETYAVSAIAVILLGSSVFMGSSNAIVYPLLIGAASIVTTIIGSWFVKIPKNGSIMGALYKSLIVSGVLSAVAFYPITKNLMGNNGHYAWENLFYSALTGLVVTALIVFITEYYTSKDYSPVKPFIYWVKYNRKSNS
jgi:K(+)-stimulated pyrophosphate-energized sodium pump